MIGKCEEVAAGAEQEEWQMNHHVIIAEGTGIDLMRSHAGPATRTRFSSLRRLIMPACLSAACLTAGACMTADERRANTVQYRCANGTDLVVTFHEDFVETRYGDGRKMDLPQVKSAEGFLYRTTWHELRGDRSQVNWTVEAQPPIQCRAGS